MTFYESIKMQDRIIISWAIMAWLCFTVILGQPHIVAAADGANESVANVDVRLLEGNWVRPDGGYVLELSNMEFDGSLTARYFNPRQIRVSQAFWIITEETIGLFVELRDINYPGSKYSLRYDPSSDRLQGAYFQAMEGQIYAVEFVRKQ